jgi:hypothetical protein
MKHWTFDRDSMVWWFGAAGGAATFLLGHYELLTRAFPGLGLIWQARIELLGVAATGVSLYLRASPRPLNPDGRLAQQPANPAQTLTAAGKMP